jgi:hypothetical protein
VATGLATAWPTGHAPCPVPPRQGRGDVVVEDDEGIRASCLAAVSPCLLLHGLRPARISEPILSLLPWNKDHPSDEDEQINRKPISDQHCRVGAERRANHDQVAPAIDRIDDGVGILPEAGSVVVTWQVGSDDVMAPADAARAPPSASTSPRPRHHGPRRMSRCRALLPWTARAPRRSSVVPYAAFACSCNNRSICS